MVILEDMSIADSRTLAPFADLTFRTDHNLAVGNAEYHRQLWTKRS
jgi:hypothetical protein